MDLAAPGTASISSTAIFCLEETGDGKPGTDGTFSDTSSADEMTVVGPFERVDLGAVERPAYPRP